mmetsp:Transcript_22065/g.42879  ORF Transcript_22065/g.42879 Transcript_22065/m.42879 type:complete len:223 (-) Transcript_22065:445-1113(-)|eukprot:CAMPEP_0173393736 /NCGR_PEP_ID=MMETSP1356-20130122/22281_1 /TAXON_ID=77927 ORGANISM="Hemiselmis virescens, Strain PCC157" /NCGR_SAMPLE_ID=MMETSP1356 /ASSEMBLY_ACC=CAM_ASM_000847 /LENGTH=222 /DNA_ID=CAMNT_0014351799 /DNA_START=67 /DNA_END=735 /DNA_ORIENTATION=-
MGVDDQFEEEEEEVSWQYRTPALCCLVGGLALTLFLIFICLVAPSSSYMLKSKCSPIDDPKLEHFKSITGSSWRASVKVNVVNHRDGSGASMMARGYKVYNSADGAKSPLKVMEQAWASSHCLCPGCDGLHKGTCHGCIPGSPGCEEDPPEYDCYVVVSNPDNSYPHYSIGVQKVVFEERFASSSDGWGVALIIFAVIAGILLMVDMLVYLPGLMGSQYKAL